MRLLSFVLLTAIGAPLFAEGAAEPAPAPTPAPPAGERKSPLIALDADQNGELSAEEITANTNERLAKRLKEGDTNGDGKIDTAEFEALAEAMKKRRQAREQGSAPAPAGGEAPAPAPAGEPGK